MQVVVKPLTIHNTLWLTTDTMWLIASVCPGIWGEWEGVGMLQQGGRRPQPVEGWCGEAKNELKHQEAAGTKMMMADHQIYEIRIFWTFFVQVLNNSANSTSSRQNCCHRCPAFCNQFINICAAQQNETNFAVCSRWMTARMNMQTSCKKPTSFR